MVLREEPKVRNLSRTLTALGDSDGGRRRLGEVHVVSAVHLRRRLRCPHYGGELKLTRVTGTPFPCGPYLPDGRKRMASRHWLHGSQTGKNLLPLLDLPGTTKGAPRSLCAPLVAV